MRTLCVFVVLTAVCLAQPRFADPVPDLKRARQQLEQARAAVDAAKSGDELAAARAKADVAQAQFVQAIRSAVVGRSTMFVDVGTPVVRSFLSAAEQNRIDKQVGAGANGTGTTSLVTKGSVPSLIGLAVESGAVAQETSGTAVTFRANPAGIAKALVRQSYLLSGGTEILANGAVRESDPWYGVLSRASASLSFDVSKGGTPGTFTASRSQLASYGGHVDLLNHRDPRDKRNQPLWDKLRTGAGTALAGALTAFSEAVEEMPAYKEWLAGARTELLEASEDDLGKVWERQMDALGKLIATRPEIVALIKDRVIPAANAYAESRTDLLKDVSKSLTLAFDYANTRQVVTLAGDESVTLPAGMTSLPDLGAFQMTASGRFIGASEITANLTATRFNGRLAPALGRWRDVRFGVEVDVPLPEIATLGKPTLSIAGLYMNLMEQPLGAKVLVNGVAESRTGSIGFCQFKIEFPAGKSGVRIPLSMTVASRTELVKESDVRANIGLTFDMDKLFARP